MIAALLPRSQIPYLDDIVAGLLGLKLISDIESHLMARWTRESRMRGYQPLMELGKLRVASCNTFAADNETYEEPRLNKKALAPQSPGLDLSEEAIVVRPFRASCMNQGMRPMNFDSHFPAILAKRMVTRKRGRLDVPVPQT